MKRPVVLYIQHYQSDDRELFDDLETAVRALGPGDSLVLSHSWEPESPAAPCIIHEAAGNGSI